MRTIALFALFAACSATAVATGPAPDSGVVDASASADMVAAPDVPSAPDVVAAVDRSAPVDTGPTCATTAVSTTPPCYTEEGCGPLCPRFRFTTDTARPAWRLTGLAVVEPVVLASPLISSVLTRPIRDGQVLWGLRLDRGSNTLRTGALNRTFTRGRVGAGLMDGAYAFYSDDAPTTGGRSAARWNSISVAATGTAVVSSPEATSLLLIPIFNEDGSIVVELPLSGVRFIDVPVGDGNGCIGLGLLRGGRYNECASEWDMSSGGAISAAITVSAARAILVEALGRTLCEVIASTSCDAPMNTWRNPPNTSVGGEPGWRLAARFTAITADIR